LLHTERVADEIQRSCRSIEYHIFVDKFDTSAHQHKIVQLHGSTHRDLTWCLQKLTKVRAPWHTLELYDYINNEEQLINNHCYLSAHKRFTWTVIKPLERLEVTARDLYGIWTGEIGLIEGRESIRQSRISIEESRRTKLGKHHSAADTPGAQAITNSHFVQQSPPRHFSLCLSVCRPRSLA